MRARTGGGVTIEAAAEPLATYPCYKSFDEFIDVGRLKSLDRLLAERIGRRAGPRASASGGPSGRMIRLTERSDPLSHGDPGRPDLWRPTEAAGEFAELMDFVATLPFEATGRAFIMYDAAPLAVPAHQDHLDPDVCHEFIWFRTNLEKPFYMLDHRTGGKLYVSSHSAWFDTVNQSHGTDARDGLTFSVRVDGRFTEELRRQIPRPKANPASAPALWARGARP